MKSQKKLFFGLPSPLGCINATFTSPSSAHTSCITLINYLLSWKQATYSPILRQVNCEGRLQTSYQYFPIACTQWRPSKHIKVNYLNDTLIKYFMTNQRINLQISCFQDSSEVVSKIIISRTLLHRWIIQSACRVSKQTWLLDLCGFLEYQSHQ